MAVDAIRDHSSLFIRLLGPYFGRMNTKKALKMTKLGTSKECKRSGDFEENLWY